MKQKKKAPLPLGLLAICLFCVWLVYESLAPHLPQAGEPPRLYSNQCQQDLRLTLLRAIQTSRESIFLVMFGLTDPEMLAALAKQMRRSVPTTVYYDPQGSPDVRPALLGADVHPVIASGLMHHKALILDNETVFLGSANLTAASLHMHDNLVIGLKNRSVARFLRTHLPESSGHFKTMVGGQELELWLLPDSRGHALNDVRKHIRAAVHSIRIALFTFTHPVLVDELIHAHQRGIDVSVVIDMHSGLGASSQAIEKLKQNGIQVLKSQGVQLLHHKFMYVDERTLLCGSANWTRAAFAKNNDLFAILHNLNADQKSFMTRLWRRIHSEAK